MRIRILLVGFASWLSAASAGWNAEIASGDLLRLEKHDEAMGSTFSVVLYDRDRAVK